MVKIDKKLLKINPLSEKIYGSFSLIDGQDALLIQSIENEGILEPIIITRNNLVVSGNRRLKVALYLGDITEVPIVYTDLQDEEIDELTIINHNQQRIKNIIQIAREFELIREKYNMKQGVKDKVRSEASKLAQETLLDENNISLSSVKRILSAKKLKTEFEKDLNNKISWTDQESWDWLFEQHKQNKKEVNSILTSIKDQVDEIKNSIQADKTPLINNEFIKIIHGNSTDLSEHLKDEEVDCIPNSPPYWGAIRTYLDDNVNVKGSKKGLIQSGHEDDVNDYLNNLMKVYLECKRVLKKTGSLFVNIADTTEDGVVMNIPGKLIELMNKEGLKCVQTIVWFKINPVYQNNKTFQPSMEYILHFVKDVQEYKWFDDWFGQEDQFLGNITYGDEEKKRRIRNTIIYYPTNNSSDAINYQGLLQTTVINNHILNKLLRKKGFELQHNALFPLEVPMVCVLSTTEPNDVVLDVYGGLSTTGLIAIAHGCKYYGVDQSKVYSAKASIRIQDFLEQNEHLVRIKN
jgi:site-specific DNA-methyltransferase (adenine-specific)